VFDGCCYFCPAHLVVCVCIVCHREQEDREERERLRKEGKPLPPELLREGGWVLLQPRLFDDPCVLCSARHPTAYLLTGLSFMQQKAYLDACTLPMSAAASADMCPGVAAVFACCCRGW
jgi:hypothetical protein